jgi:CheY-like chemotaxis protein
MKLLVPSRSSHEETSLVTTLHFLGGAKVSEQTKTFGQTATALSRNPLGIIALFIVLVYGFASLVTAFSGSLTTSERVPLIYFLVLFPILVLIVFGWLVSSHSEKLYSPGDYKDEENYLKMRLAIAASLSAATASRGKQEREQLSNVEVATKLTRGGLVRLQNKEVLWVDDNPDNNVYVRQALESAGLRVQLALSTEQAIAAIAHRAPTAIISDMGRREGPREGYALLDQLRQTGNQTPFFIFAGSSAAEHKAEALKRGAQGSTNSAKELFEMVINAALGS